MSSEAEFLVVLGYIVEVLLSLSIIGSVLTIVTFSVFKELRTFPLKLIIFLCTSLALAHFFFLIAFDSTTSDFCIPSAVLLHYFFLANFAWSFCVAMNFYQMIVRRNRDVDRLEGMYHWIGWGWPGILVCIVGVLDDYGDIGGVCYMNSQAAIFATFFIPGLLVTCVNSVIFFFVLQEIRGTLKAAPKAEGRDQRREARVYVSIVISIGLSWVFGFLMVVFSDGSVPRYICLVLFSLTTPLQGLLIFFCYCWNAKVFGRWAALLGRCIPFFRRWERMGTMPSAGPAEKL